MGSRQVAEIKRLYSHCSPSPGCFRREEVVEGFSVTVCFLLSQRTFSVSDYDGWCDCVGTGRCLEAPDNGLGESGKKVRK